jgi:DNA-binding response OmpR family regulator
LRDPVRQEVLFAYLTRYREERKATIPTSTLAGGSFVLAGIRVHPETHQLEKTGRMLKTAPQVVELLRLMSRSGGRTVPYQELYIEVFSRRFTGDTTSARVLLAKATTAFARLGVNLRSHIKVIAKSGYLMTPASSKRRRDEP